MFSAFKIKSWCALLALTLITNHVAVAEDNKVLKPSPFCLGIMNAIGVTPEQAIEKLGKPSSREDRKMKSTHAEGVMDTVVILTYAAGRIGFLNMGETGKYILLGVEMPASMFNTQLKSVIPASRDETLAKLGEPQEEHDDPNKLRYFCNQDLTEWVDLAFDPTSQKTRAMVFTSHID